MKLSGNLQVLIDCSTLLSGIFYPKGKPNKILLLWKNNLFNLCITDSILAEYKNKIGDFSKRTDKDPQKAIIWFTIFKKRAVLINSIAVPKNSCRDHNDLIYLEAAAGANADCLISSDKDLLILKKFQQTKILTPAQFIKQLKPMSSLL